VAFAERISQFGWHNSMVQLVIKLTAPGVPDIYQGADLWELSMVDPDNRRAVDFALRMKELRSDTPLSDLLARWRDGGLKLRLTHALLNLRKAFPDVFLNGTYQPLATGGKDAARVCAYMRTTDETTVVVALCLFPSRGVATDCDAEIVGLPDDRMWRDVFNRKTFHRSSISAHELFTDLPIAVLSSQRI
jgi:(1->4)-alpha-D-glucan 1-alpha-D-glucosylmutase